MTKACFVLIALALPWLTGCASQPANTPSTGSASSTANAAVQTPAATTGAAIPAAQTAAAAADLADEPPNIDLPAGLKDSSAPFEGEGWESLFTGSDLSGWAVTKFVGRNAVEVKSGVIILHMGDPFTGISYTNEFPKTNYEVAFDAMRVMGNDFFCGLTLPFETNYFSYIVGGWGGGVVGISSINGMDASENESTRFLSFEAGKWHRIRVRVTKERIEAWIDNKKTVDVVTKEKRISPRPGEIEKSIPFGIASWQTASALREIKWRPTDTPADPPKKQDW